jgi:hypothetical protein
MQQRKIEVLVLRLEKADGMERLSMIRRSLKHLAQIAVGLIEFAGADAAESLREQRFRRNRAHALLRIMYITR